MDFRRPVEAVIPGVQGRILAVLAETTAELNLRTIARLSGVSPAQASRVLPELVGLGLVERREAPPSALFTLVDDNVAARLVRALSNSRETVLQELGALAGQMDPSPVSAIVFGSLARGEADALSDVDVVLVRPADVDEDTEPWISSAEGWRTSARRLSGNPVRVIEIAETDVARHLRRPSSLWADVLREGVVVYGSSLELLRTAGPDGVAVAKELARLLPMKARAEYEPDDIPNSDAARAVERARRIVEVARRVESAQRSD